MRVLWDEGKSKKLERERGWSFYEVADIFTGHYIEWVKNDDPDQWLAVASFRGTYVSVVYETRHDGQGEYLWLVTYWKSTKQEITEYET
jgi:uncharacterized DUF497 family protein